VRPQLQVLNSLLTTQRFSRLVEQEAIDGAAAYRLRSSCADLRKGSRRDLREFGGRLTPYRRNLQRAYLDLISTRLMERSARNDDQRPMFRGELRTIAAVMLARHWREYESRHAVCTLQDVAPIRSPKIRDPGPIVPAGQIRLPRPPAVQPLRGTGDIFLLDGRRYSRGVEQVRIRILPGPG
jgi:hypothetical protein